MSADANLPTALRELAAALRAADLPLAVPGRDEAAAAARELVDQVEDYLLPRLDRMDAPLLMVVGGSTGAGKSTLVNSLAGADVSPSGVLRPTTRAPVLVCHPDDVGWFEGDRVLGGMSRTRGASSTPGSLQLVPTTALPAGLALLDSPDIDSVVEANRALSRQLLAAADAWLFVTTAARYADAVPWELLQAARDRGTALSLVLDRVPAEAVDDVADHLWTMIAERGLDGAELLVVEEVELADGRLPAAALAPVRSWLDDLAADAQARSALVRRTLTGALDSLPRRTAVVTRALAEQADTAEGLRDDAGHAYARGLEEIDEAVRSGSLLRGEVLARWHDVIGTGEFMRALESRLGRLRDRVRSLVTGTPAAEAELRTAVESSVDAVVYAAADRAAERAAAAWRGRPAGRALLEGGARLDAASADLLPRTRDEVRAWQGEVFELVSREAAGKRSTARVASLGVNGAGLVVMLAVFAQTGGLTGAEIAVAGGTTAAGQRILEALLGDQAVRTLATRAREMLLQRTHKLLAGESERFHALLGPLAPEPHAAQRLREALGSVERVR
jgi:energy-coupling factor transporter ATP-binding protein EcfA2